MSEPPPKPGNRDDAVAKYIAKVNEQAADDAELLIAYYGDIGLDPKIERVGDALVWMRRVIASIYFASRRRDADHSPELIRLALRFCLDPRKTLVGDWQDYRCKRAVDGTWRIHSQSQRGVAGLLPTLGEGRKISFPLSNLILDYILLEPRQLSEIRNAVVRAFGGIPSRIDCIPRERRPRFTFQLGDDDTVCLRIGNRVVQLPDHADVHRLLCALCTDPRLQLTGKEARTEFDVNNSSRAVNIICKALGQVYPEAAGWLASCPIGWVSGCAPKRVRGSSA